MVFIEITYKLTKLASLKTSDKKIGLRANNASNEEKPP
jgi:hypothetical protein